MAKASDVRVETATVSFYDERLTVPLHLSRGAIREITYAKVTVGVQTRAGKVSQGTGAILLSDLWAFPDPSYSHKEKDVAMRALCATIARQLQSDGDYGDPLEKGHQLEQVLPRLVVGVERQMPFLAPGSFPDLAALNCLAPFDAAIHDAWGRALGGSVYQFYDAEWLNADLGHYLGEGWRGRYPVTFLGKRRQRLVIQHVVGVSDALTPEPERNEHCAAAHLPQDLTGWIRSYGLTSFKLKIRGQDPVADAQRVAAVFATACAAGLSPDYIHLSLDPNEGCEGPAFLLTLLDLLESESPAALAALDYIEQPTGRDLASYTFTLHEVAQRVPVIIDESLNCLENLALLEPLGWSGLALKTCKGQTHSLLAYCWAKQRGLFVTLQDLTNPGLALVHSANLCAQLHLAVDGFESNSRQFMPQARVEEQADYPDYFQVRHGCLHLPDQPPKGLY